MAMFLQRTFGLPVLAIRLGQDDGLPCADLRLVDNSEQEYKVIDQRLLPLTAFGPQALGSEGGASLSVPPEILGWVAEWVHETLDPGSVLWLHFVKPYGVLGAVPWERDLQPRVGIPVLRLPDSLPDQRRSSSVFDVALVATAPATKGESPAVLIGPPVARAIAAGVGERLRLHVFADREGRSFLERELAGLPARAVTIHHFEKRSVDRRTPSGELRNGWLRWIRQAMGAHNLDAVHFIVHGMRFGPDGAVATPLEVDSFDRDVPVSVQSGELRAFLTQVGALAVGFSRPPDNYSDFGLRRLVDDLGAVRAGPVVLHDPALDPEYDQLRNVYAFLASDVPSLPPATPCLSLMAQPQQVYAPGSPALPTSSAQELPPPTGAVTRQFASEDTPMWLAAAERYIEQQQGELIRYRQSTMQRRPTPAEEAYFSGVESALRKIREVVDRHAEAES